MIQFLKILFIVFIKQILFVASFCFAIYINSDVSYLIPIILLILYLISHFIHIKEICEKLKLDKILYNVYGFISWMLCNGVLVGILFDSWLFEILPKTGGMFSGLEYIFAPIFLCAYLIILCVLKLIIFIISKLTKKINLL